MTVVYDRTHQAIRRGLLATYAPTDPCWRCGFPLGPDPSRIDLGHRDDGPGWAGLEHAYCSRAAGARKGNKRRRARRERSRPVITQAAMALEISEDRLHTSIVTAGRLRDGLVLVDLAAYLNGTDPVAAVKRLQKDLQLMAVVIDPHSHAATAVRPLEAAGVTVTRPASGDIAEAHGLFLDSLAAGKVRHLGQPELSAAMRHLEQRRLGGATAPERRGSAVDVGPAVAAELACWALLTIKPPPLPVIY
jgi:hypothetical protein